MIGENQTDQKIVWYRSPVDRKMITLLNQRSDWKGLAQTLGHLGLLVMTGASAWYASKHLPVWSFLLILFIHGTFFAFLLNAFHELCHKTVFKTKALNTIFLQIVSFLSWNNPVQFWTSHQEHHKYTLHPPRDLEVVLPVLMSLSLFLKSTLVNPWDFIGRFKDYFRLSFGRLQGEWEHALFPDSDAALRRSLFRWARFHLIGHALILIVSLSFGLWMVPIVVTLAPFYGGAIQFLCNNTQHIGLQDNVPDFRLCSRTILLNPFLRFLYWNMNYHTEHHMYAAVPCYNLGKLHAYIKADLPDCPRGLLNAWKEIIAILKKQKVDPSYQYVAKLPERQSQIRSD
jgi:fatty acid desaturase